MYLFFYFTINILSLSPDSFLSRITDNWVSYNNQLDEEGYLKGYSLSYVSYLKSKEYSIEAQFHPYHFLQIDFPYINVNEVERESKASVSLFYNFLIGTLKRVSLHAKYGCSKLNHEENIKSLMHLITLAKADLNTSSAFGSALSIVAAGIGENDQTLDFLNILLQQGADPNAFSSSYKTVSFKEAELAHNVMQSYATKNLDCPLSLAINCNNYNSAILLLFYGANPDEVICNNSTVFMCFLQKISQESQLSDEKTEKVLNLLEAFLRSNPDFCHQNIHGQTALHIINHNTWKSSLLQKEIQKSIKVHLKENPLANGSRLIQDINGVFMDGTRSSTPTSILVEDPLILPLNLFTANPQNEDMNALLNHLECLPNLLAVMHCLSRTCFALENTQTFYSHSFFIFAVQLLCIEKIKKEKLTPSEFINQYKKHEIPFDHLILFALALTQSEDRVVSQFCVSLLLKLQSQIKKKTLDSQIISPRAHFFLQLFVPHASKEQFIDINALADEMLQGNVFAYPLILMLSEKNSFEIFHKMSQKNYLSAIYNPRNAVLRVMEMALYKNIGGGIAEKRDHLYKQNLTEIQEMYSQMKEEVRPLHHLKDIVSKEDSLFLTENFENIPLEVHGRSVVITVRGKQYHLKLKKKSESDKSFLDGAVINWSLKNKFKVIERQFKPAYLVQVEPELLEKIMTKISQQDEFKNVQLSGEAVVFETHHSDYYSYLVVPQDNPYQSLPQEEQRKKLHQFVLGLERSMRDYSYCAERNLFFNDLTSISHGDDRTYNFAAYYFSNDTWDHGIGVVEDIIYGAHISNIGQEGMRDLGNLLDVNVSGYKRLEKGFSKKTKQMWSKFPQKMRDTFFRVSYSQTLVEHLFGHYMEVLVFLHENREILINLNAETFQYIILKSIVDPFLEEHFQSNQVKQQFDILKQHVYYFLRDLIEEDWVFFQRDPAIIKEAITRNTARDFPLQNFYTGVARLVSLVNLKEEGCFPIDFDSIRLNETKKLDKKEESKNKFEEMCAFLSQETNDTKKFLKFISIILKDTDSFILYIHHSSFELLSLTNRLLCLVKENVNSFYSNEKREVFKFFQNFIFYLIEQKKDSYLPMYLEQLEQNRFIEQVITTECIITWITTYQCKRLKTVIPYLKEDLMSRISVEEVPMLEGEYTIINIDQFIFFLEHLIHHIDPESVYQFIKRVISKREWNILIEQPFFKKYLSKNRRAFVYECYKNPILAGCYAQSLKQELEEKGEDIDQNELKLLMKLKWQSDCSENSPLFVYFKYFVLKQKHQREQRISQIFSKLQNVKDFYWIISVFPEFKERFMTVEYLSSRMFFLQKIELFSFIYHTDKALLQRFPLLLKEIPLLEKEVACNKKIMDVCEELSISLYDVEKIHDRLNEKVYSTHIDILELFKQMSPLDFNKVMLRWSSQLKFRFIQQVLHFYIKSYDTEDFDGGVYCPEVFQIIRQVVSSISKLDTSIKPQLLNTLFQEVHGDPGRIKHLFHFLDQVFVNSFEITSLLSCQIVKEFIKKQLFSCENIQFKDIAHPESPIYLVLKTIGLLQEKSWILSFFKRDYQNQLSNNQSKKLPKGEELQNYLLLKSDKIVQNLHQAFSKGRDPILSLIELQNKGVQFVSDSKWTPSMIDSHIYRLSDVFNYVFFQKTLPRKLDMQKKRSILMLGTTLKYA